MLLEGKTHGYTGTKPFQQTEEKRRTGRDKQSSDLPSNNSGAERRVTAQNIQGTKRIFFK